MKRIEAVNDFVIKFANVNGSGSASANEMFAKSILRMGVPVSPRNIFPSNIQGLPTWYEVRVNEQGWLGRRGGVDLMVAMNPQTWDADVKEIETGGYLFYDNSKPLPKSRFREDVTTIGMPLTEICNATYDDPRQRQLFKNIMYIGALSHLLDMDPAVIEALIAQQYKAKVKLLDANKHALHLGRDYAREHLNPIGLRVRKADNVGDKIFIDGNSAAALGCVYGGATVCAWYPITPSSSLAEAFQSYCQKLRVDPETGKNRYAIVQAEDEIASIGMVVGAGWNGARAFTAGGLEVESLTDLGAGFTGVVFPEASRSHERSLRRFRRGAIAAAIRAGVPIVPAFVSVVPPMLMKHQAWYDVPRRGGHYSVEFFPVIETAGRELDSRAVTRELRARYELRHAQMLAERDALTAATAPGPKALPG